MFTPAPGMVLVKLFEDTESVLQSADRNYERVAEVIEGFNIPLSFGIEPGCIIFFDEYAYRRFTWNGEDYCVVNVSEPGALWGIIKKNASTETEPVQETGVSTPIQNDSAV